MLKPLFIAVRRFDPSDGDKWQKYCRWAKIPRLTEVISLDSLLCPRVITEFQPDDWDHIVNEDFRLNYFYDFEYLMRRVAGAPRKQILGVYRNPDAHLDPPPAVGDFTFIGYDLVEDQTQISALTNCGGFPDSFSNTELNRHGLIDTLTRAAEVQRHLAKQHPEEHHAQCDLYAIWRLAEMST